jgi:hypothetical protein
MGIKDLNRFLKDHASGAIQLTNMSDLYGKTISVDISIYMYRFASDNLLIENMYLMLSIFKHYNMMPIFVFDGKPPPEKSDILQKRKQDKSVAEKEYVELKQVFENNVNMNENEKCKLWNEIECLKKKTTSITKSDVEIVKKLIVAYGYSYCDAVCEADEVCAFLNTTNKVWGCLSEDTDMFVYGCKRVLRYLSLTNHTVVVYEMNRILEILGITQEELRAICVLSGTDYNMSNADDTNVLSKTLKQFKAFRREKSSLTFYEWLNKNGNLILSKYDLMLKINDMFDLSLATHLDAFNNVQVLNNDVNKVDIKQILKTDGFLFA